MRNTVTLDGVNGSPGYIELFPLVISLLAENLDLLGSISEIVESYILVDVTRVLSVSVRDIGTRCPWTKFRRSCIP